MNLQHERLQTLCYSLNLTAIPQSYAALAHIAAQDNLSYPDFLESAKPLHTTHISHKIVKIYYKWHPLYQKPLSVQREVIQKDYHFIHCYLPDGTVAAFPAWMMDRQQCSQLTEGPPQLALEDLINLHCFLDDISCHPERVPPIERIVSCHCEIKTLLTKIIFL